jgi:hypothetical protein
LLICMAQIKMKLKTQAGQKSVWAEG